MRQHVTTLTLSLAAGLASLTLLASPTLAQQQVLRTERIANGITGACWVGGVPGDNTRLFVIEKNIAGTGGRVGRIRVINNLTTTPTLNATPFWTSPFVANNINEEGLLGIVFHPQYATNGYLWAWYTRATDNDVMMVRIRRGTTPDLADAVFIENVLTIDHPQINHNGSWMQFGSDGYLYIGTGDGGGGNDDQPPSGATTGNAQDITDNLRGKILRIDVDGPDNIPGNADDDGFPADATKLYTIPPTNPFVGITGDDEIFHYGVRNPWRNNFDSLTGELWIADVGQDQREEINVLPAGAIGLNLGWRCYEATRVTGLGGCSPLPTPVHMPIAEYANSPFPAFAPFNISGCAITGGILYRGASMPCLRGTYFFADYCSGDIFSINKSGSTITNIINRRTQLDPPGTLAISNVTTFGTDNAGEMYICDDAGGEVYRVLPNGFSGTFPDCNSNGNPDSCDIASGISTDTNANGIPDECDAPTCDTIDFNGDGLLPDTQDIDDYLSVFSGGPCSTGTCGDVDFNNDGLFPDTTDIDSLLSVFSGGPCL